MKMILGIDPGSRITGYGLIRSDGRRDAYVASGCIRCGKGELPERLHTIYTGLHSLITQYQPDEAAIEEVFMHRNPNSALKLGQARGAAIVAVSAFSLDVAEYSPRMIKLSVVGYGGAEKEQVQHMVGRLLNLQGTLQEDAADALAVALCHAHSRRFGSVASESVGMTSE